MFLDVSEQVFILVFDVWMRFRQNREKIQIIAILVKAFAYEFTEQPGKAGINNPSNPAKSAIFANMALELKMIMKMNSLTPN